MTNAGDDLRSITVENLTALGLSEYAARTLVALTRIDGGSARDVSEASAVPRTRVYDAVDELAERGLVSVTESHPKRFSPASPQRIRRAFFREYVPRLAAIELEMRAFEPVPETAPSPSVTVETDPAAVDRRFLAGIESASDRITLVVAGDPPSETVLAGLSAAAEGGVTVRYVGLGEFDAEVVGSAVPAGTVLAVPDASTRSDAFARFLLVDDDLVVICLRTDGGDGRGETCLLTERPSGEVAASLHRVADTWFADASEERTS